MAHRRPPLALALAINTVVTGSELAAGIAGGSLSLLGDGLHNLSDELGLALLLLAYSLPRGLSGHALRAATLVNSAGIFAIAATLAFGAASRLANPVPVDGMLTIAVATFGVVGNLAVARALRSAARFDPAIRLAFVHNVGDALLSLGPLLAGVLVLVTGSAAFDSVFAIVLALFVAVSTVRTFSESYRELLWPEGVVCGHAGDPQAGPNEG